jgi:hypothetical protein
MAAAVAIAGPLRFIATTFFAGFLFVVTISLKLSAVRKITCEQNFAIPRQFESPGI